MKKWMMLALACAGLACAAEEARVQKIVPVTTGDAQQIYGTLITVMNNMPLQFQRYQNTIVLNGTPEAVASAEQLIKNMMSMSPRERGIEITGSIILASAEAKPDSASMPADLDPVLKQFRSLLNYKSFRVLDTLILRGKENSGMGTTGFLTIPGSQPGTSEFRVQHPAVTDEIIHLKDLMLRVMIPTGFHDVKGDPGFHEVRIATDADIKAGQKVAIGKASVDANGDALILVVSAKVVD